MSSHKEGKCLDGLTGKGKKRREMYLVLVFEVEEVGTYRARRYIAKSSWFERVAMNVEVWRIRRA
jgi:hypothetical protein